MAKSEPTAAVYSTQQEAEEAVKELRKANFDVKKISIVGRDYHAEESAVGYYNDGGRMKYWGKSGAFWDGIWGSLSGAAIFWVPGIGQILIAGPLANAIVGGLDGAALLGSFDTIGAGLYSLGITKENVLKYQAALKANKLVVVAQGTPDETVRAQKILLGRAHA